MLDDEVRQFLREFAQAARLSGVPVSAVSVVHASAPPEEPGARVVPLGSGAFLRVHASLSGDAPDDSARAGLSLAEYMERCARSLRACARRWGVERVPECAFNAATGASAMAPRGDRVLGRIREFLRGLAGSHSADLVVVTLRREVVAASEQPGEAFTEQLPFISRRVAVEAERRRTSHAELASADFYAVSFWFDACLVVFFSAPFAVDFVRHRARLVTRELAPLLAMLDEPPPAPANVSPIPE